MRLPSPVVCIGKFLLLMLLVGCRRYQEAYDDRASHGGLAEIRAQSIRQEGKEPHFKVWGYAESKNEEARGAGRNFLEMSARASAQHMLTLAAGVSIRGTETGMDVKGGSIVSMIVISMLTTSSSCLVQASGSVNPAVPNEMKKLKTVSGTATLAKSKFMHELLKSAKTALREIKTNDSINVAGFIVLRKMELVAAKETPACHYELDIYFKE